MSFLSSTATIDAVVTKKGRELLASGQFKPTKFALADDEIDYGMLSLEDGESKVLETMVLEASSLGNDANTQLKYKLIISDGQILIPQISVQPRSVDAVIYDIYEIRLSTTEWGTDRNYTIVNNSNYLTLNVNQAIRELNKQLYIPVSGKDYQTVLAQLQALKSVYPFHADSREWELPETYTTRPGSDGSHKFFVFCVAPIEGSPLTVNISGNNSGAVSEFTIQSIAII